MDNTDITNLIEEYIRKSKAHVKPISAKTNIIPQPLGQIKSSKEDSNEINSPEEILKALKIENAKLTDKIEKQDKEIARLLAISQNDQQLALAHAKLEDKTEQEDLINKLNTKIKTLESDNRKAELTIQEYEKQKVKNNNSSVNENRYSRWYQRPEITTPLAVAATAVVLSNSEEMKEAIDSICKFQ